jgi:hypothetical protein
MENPNKEHVQNCTHTIHTDYARSKTELATVETLESIKTTLKQKIESPLASTQGMHKNTCITTRVCNISSGFPA